MNLLLIVGTGRCGSTLLYQAMAAHRDLAFLTALDEHLPRPALLRRVPPAIFRWGYAREHPSRPKRWLADRCQPAEAWPVLDREVAPIMGAPFRDLRGDDCMPWMRPRLTELFRTVAAAQASDHVIFKVTGWPRVGMFRAAFPNVRIIHVVRDGRAVANSLLQTPWWPGYAGPSGWTFGELEGDEIEMWDTTGRSYPALAGLEWRRLTRAIEHARTEVPAEEWLELRYEDLVDRPDDLLVAACEFAGLRGDDAVRRHASHMHIVKDRVRAYETDLSAADLTCLTRILSEDLARYGYR